MWDSNGDLNHADREVVDPGPTMTVSGKIEGNSHVRLICTGGSITVNGDIDGSAIVQLVSSGGPITINGKIDGSAVVVLVSTTDAVTIADKCDGSSHTTIEARGNVTIGTQGEKKIDGSAGVSVVAGGDITLGSYIHSATVDFQAHGAIRVGELDGSAKFMALADGDITIDGKIDGSSRAELVSNRKSVMVNGKIDGSAKVALTAGTDVGIGVGQQGGDEDHKIDGNATVVAIANRDITLGSRIGGSDTTVDFVAGGKVTFGKNISGGAHVRLLSAGTSITIPGGVDGGSTTLETAPTGAANPAVSGGAQWTQTDWASVETFTPNPDRGGYWWQNWPHTFGYVAPFRVVPRSLDDIVTAVQGTPSAVAPDVTPIRAVGGGWSFTDASLPFRTAAEVAQASLVERGRWQRQDLRDRLDGLGDDYRPPMDLVPEMVGRNVPFSTMYDQSKLRQVTQSGPQLPPSKDVRLIDTRSLASSLHCEFDGIRAPASRRRRHPKILFHVEAGITMADLQQLLDHQHPRLAIRASGGSPGATLAGALATATHGGEYNAPLLVDAVCAVHLVGPGGEQWWIEGDYPVADQAKLQARYPAIDPAHFIGGSWNAIPGMSAQDVLDAVVVSMGSMGVTYSMVIEVFPQFGLHQVVHPTSWAELLSAASTTEGALQAGTAAANQAVLDTLIDGQKNGTRIGAATNEYVDLAINPLNLDCWIVNREMTALPDDPNSPAPAFGDYQNALTRSIQQHAVESVFGSMFLGRVFDFFYLGTDPVTLVAHDIGRLSNITGFVTRYPDVMGTLLAAATAQTVGNLENQSGTPDRGLEFLADMLSGFFHALEGTEPGVNCDHTGLSYQVGAIGWPDTGLPGRALEIALDPTNAFTFLQTVLIDDVIANTVVKGKNPLVGYISVRVTPTTHTLLGMQQYAPHSVMIEVVAYRSPAANTVMDEIQRKTLAWSGPGPKPLLHWGLENDLVDHTFLMTTPLGQPYKGFPSRLDAFKAVRTFLQKGHPQPFDNAFTTRIGV